MQSLSHWRVCKDFADPMFNYLVYGFEPGSLFKGWYANDATAILHSHPANTVEALKDLTKWMVNCMPHAAWGSHEKVQDWIRLVSDERRALLEKYNLVYTEQEEIMMLLKGEPIKDSYFQY